MQSGFCPQELGTSTGYKDKHRRYAVVLYNSEGEYGSILACAKGIHNGLAHKQPTSHSDDDSNHRASDVYATSLCGDTTNSR